MLHANHRLMDELNKIEAEISALTAEWTQLNEMLTDAAELMLGKSPTEKKLFDDNFSITFRAECDRIDEIESIVKSLRSQQSQLEYDHYTNL
jgi:uncharacterized protein with von Willebrand factor type A (vWA) domain